ncbi:MAG: hypothetical protein ACXVFN_05435 [Solirubrobacteraceae bacterium]
MPNTLILVKTGPRANEILDAFQERTGMAARDADHARIFTVEGAPRAVDPTEELTAIDPAWAEHLELATQV